MRRFRDFVGNALVSGIVFSLPVYLCLLLLLKAIDSLGRLVRPLAALLPSWFPGEKVLSVVMVLAICLLIGAAIRTPFGSAMRKHVEDGFLSKVPGYHVFTAYWSNWQVGARHRYGNPRWPRSKQPWSPHSLLKNSKTGVSLYSFRPCRRLWPDRSIFWRAIEFIR